MTDEEVNEHIDRIMEVIKYWVQHIPSENEYDYFLKGECDWESVHNWIIESVPVYELLWGNPIYVDRFNDKLCKFLAEKEKEVREKEVLDALDNLPD